MDLRLRPLRLEDEAEVVAAHEIMRAEDFPFMINGEPGIDWAAHVQFHDDARRGLNLPDHLVPATFLVAVVDGVIVGRSSIRFRLNDYLAAAGGHIGYCVLPVHRRRGYATEILRQSLVIVRAEGEDDVLVTCDEHNVASAATIERCGGVLQDVVDNPSGGPRKCRYWIT